MNCSLNACWIWLAGVIGGPLSSLSLDLISFSWCSSFSSGILQESSISTSRFSSKGKRQCPHLFQLFAQVSWYPAKRSYSSWHFNDLTTRFLELLARAFSTIIWAWYFLWLFRALAKLAMSPKRPLEHLTKLSSLLVRGFPPALTVHLKTGGSAKFRRRFAEASRCRQCECQLLHLLGAVQLCERETITYQIVLFVMLHYKGD